MCCPYMYVCIVPVHSVIVAFPFVQTTLLYIRTCDANLLACMVVYIVDNVLPETMLTVGIYYSAVKPRLECETKV